MVLPILIYVFGAVGAAIAGADPYSVELEAFIKCEMALGPGAPRIDLSHHSFVWTSRVDGNDSKMRQFRSHVEAALAKSRRTPIPISWNGVSKYLATFVQLGDRPNRLIRVNYNLEPRRIVRIDRAARVESEFDHDLKRMSNYRSIHADFGEWRISIAAFDGARAAHATVDDVRFALSHPLAPAVFHSTENNYALHVGRTPVGTALKILTSFNLSLNLLTIVDVVACNNEQVENFPMLRRLIDPVHDERIPIPVTGSLAGLRIRTPNDLHQKLARKWRVSWPALIEALREGPRAN